MPWALGAVPPGYDPRTIQRVQRPISPTDTTAFSADFSGALDAGVDDDTITQVISVNTLRNDDGSDGFGVAIPPAIVDGRRVTIWVTDGTNGYEYLVSVRVGSVAGQDLTRSFIVPVMGR